MRALKAWLLASDCAFGPVFRKVDLWGNIEHHQLIPTWCREILLKRAKLAGITVPAGERLSPHGLRAGFVTEALWPAPATSRSWRTPAMPTSRRCAAMCGGPSSSPRARPSCWGCKPCRRRPTARREVSAGGGGGTRRAPPSPSPRRDPTTLPADRAAALARCSRTG